jgi:uncharacterized protein
VSAFIAAGPPSRIIEEVIDGRLELVLPHTVMAELERILTEKLGFEPERWREVQRLLLELSVVEPEPASKTPPEPLTGDPDDDVILAGAARAGVDALVSGDRRHLLPIGEHRGVRVITPQKLLAELHGA